MLLVLVKTIFSGAKRAGILVLARGAYSKAINSLLLGDEEEKEIQSSIAFKWSIKTH